MSRPLVLALALAACAGPVVDRRDPEPLLVCWHDGSRELAYAAEDEQPAFRSLLEAAGWRCDLQPASGSRRLRSSASPCVAGAGASGGRK